MTLRKISILAIIVAVLLVGIQSFSCAALRSKCSACYYWMNVGPSQTLKLRATSCSTCSSTTSDGIPINSGDDSCATGQSPINPRGVLPLFAYDGGAPDDGVGGTYEYDVEPSTGENDCGARIAGYPTPGDAGALSYDTDQNGKNHIKYQSRCSCFYFNKMIHSGIPLFNLIGMILSNGGPLVQSGTYEADSDPTHTLAVGTDSNTGNAYYVVDGSQFFSANEAGQFRLDRVIDEDGKVYDYRYTDVNGQQRLSTVHGPDGDYVYGYDGSGNLTSVQYPGEPNPRVLMEYSDPSYTNMMTKQTVQDPYNPGQSDKQYSTSYTYDMYGNHITTLPSGVKSIAYFNGNQVMMVRLVDENKAYGQTGFTFTFDSTTNQSKTEIRYYADPGLPFTDPNDPNYDPYAQWGNSSSSDRIVELVYDISTEGDKFLNSRTDKWSDSTGSHWHKVEYVVDKDPNSWTFGYKTRMTESAPDPKGPLGAILSRSVDYEYYSPGLFYKLSDGSSLPDHQYDFSSPSDVMYVEDPTGQGVRGNSLLKRKTVTANSVSYTTTFRYAVRQEMYTGETTPTNYMTDYLILQKDENDNVRKTVVDAYGNPLEEYVPTKDGALVKAVSATYDDGSLDERLKGLARSITYYGVGNTGTVRDLAVNCDYSFGSDGSRTLTGTFRDKDGNIKTGTYWASASGQSSYSIDENGHRTDYSSDYLGRTLQEKFSPVDNETDGQRKTVSYTYDDINRTISAKDESDHQYYAAFDRLGRVESEWTDIQVHSGFANARLASYTYKDNEAHFGALDSMTRYIAGVSGSVGKTFDYEYDGAGRLVKLTYPGGVISSEEALYDDFDRLVAVKDGNGKITTAEYDNFDRITSLRRGLTGTLGFPVTAPNPTTTFAYTDPAIFGGDSSVAVTETIDESTGETITSNYIFDRLDDLKTYTPAVPDGYGSLAYTWDIWGRKTSVSIPLGYSNLGRRISYSYDNWGRQAGMDVSAWAASGPGTILSGPADPGSTRFYYDENYNRIGMINSAGDIYCFVYDPTNEIPVPVYEQSPANRYLNILDPTGVLVRREKYLGASRVADYTYHFDGHGSTLALSDEDGNVLPDAYAYGAWGDVTHTGSIADNPYTYAGAFGYYSHYQEAALDQFQLGMRYYDPNIGRFSQQDPIGDGVNWYAYCDGNAISRIDPSGLWYLIDDIRDIRRNYRKAHDMVKRLDDQARNIMDP